MGEANILNQKIKQKDKKIKNLRDIIANLNIYISKIKERLEYKNKEIHRLLDRYPTEDERNNRLLIQTLKENILELEEILDKNNINYK